MRLFACLAELERKKKRNRASLPIYSCHFSGSLIYTVHLYLKYKALEDGEECSSCSMECKNDVIQLNWIDSSWMSMEIFPLKQKKDLKVVSFFLLHMLLPF